MSTTNPAYLVFTVPVEFNGTKYDVEIRPTYDGQPIEWIDGHVDQWNEVERTRKVFSKTIVQMLEKTNVAADSLESLGKVTSVDQFTFGAPESKAATQEVWEEFIQYLRYPESLTAGRDPVAEEVLSTGPGVEINFTLNAYLNLTQEEKACLKLTPEEQKDLGPEEQKAALVKKQEAALLNKQKETRLSLFIKKCYENFALADGFRLGRIGKYTPAEEACLVHLLYPNRFSPRLTPEAERLGIMSLKKLSEEEKEEMASKYDLIEKEWETMTCQLANKSSSNFDLDSSDEESVQAEAQDDSKTPPLNAHISEEVSIDESSEEINVLNLKEVEPV